MPEPPLIVVADGVDRSALELLRSGPCRVVDASADPKSLPEHLPDAWGLIVRSRTKVTASLLEMAPRLELIARAGVGVDNLDMAAVQARGIRVVNAPVRIRENALESRRWRFSAVSAACTLTRSDRSRSTSNATSSVRSTGFGR